MRKLFFISSVLAVIVMIHSCARNPVTGKSQLVLMSEAQEIQLGKESDPQIIAQYGLYEDSALQRFVSERGQQLAAVSHRPQLTYYFRVIDSDILNAFAVPGGYIYVTRGIMANFNSEADFAGVLGHEIGHVAARHSVIQQRNQILGQAGIIAGVIINPELGKFANAASQGLGLMFLRFSRDAERESDRLGVEYSTKLNYDARQMANFFTTLERESAQSGNNELPDFLSTHPNPGERNVTVNQLAAEWQQKLNVTNPVVNRNSYLKRIDGIIYGEDPRQGYRENNMFYHPVLKLQFPIPQGWLYQNSPQAVQLADKDGKALVIFTLGQGKTLQEAANAAVQQYKLQVVESQATTVNGLPAMYVIADQVTQQSSLRTISYFIQLNGTIYHFIGVADMAGFNTYHSSLESVALNFKPLTDASKINRQPDRIRLRTVSTNTTLQQALRDFNMPQDKLELLAILNGMKLTDNVAKGTFIKIIGK